MKTVRTRATRVTRVWKVALATCAALTLMSFAWIRPMRASVPEGLPTFSNPTVITNVYQPFQPGGLKTYAGGSDGVVQRVQDIYLVETRSFRWNATEVECRVLLEVSYENRRLKEVSRNYFAQADDGSIWYFGEVVDVYREGALSDHEGSWLVGGPRLDTDPRETATATNPSLFLPASPELRDRWKQEDVMPIVDSTMRVERVGVDVAVPAGTYSGAILVLETSRLDPVRGVKWFAPNVGVVKERTEGGGRLVLVESTLHTP